MTRKKQNIPEDETRGERFRRVANSRTLKTIKALDRLATMPTQPTYEVSENDGKHVLAIVKESYDKLVDTYQKAIDGTLKAKEIKEYSAIDWDKELDDDGEQTGE